MLTESYGVTDWVLQLYAYESVGKLLNIEVAFFIQCWLKHLSTLWLTVTGCYSGSCVIHEYSCASDEPTACLIYWTNQHDFSYSVIRLFIVFHLVNVWFSAIFQKNIVMKPVASRENQSEHPDYQRRCLNNAEKPTHVPYKENSEIHRHLWMRLTI